MLLLLKSLGLELFDKYLKKTWFELVEIGMMEMRMELVMMLMGIMKVMDAEEEEEEMVAVLLFLGGNFGLH